MISETKAGNYMPISGSHQCLPLILLNQKNSSSASQGKEEYGKTLSLYIFMKMIHMTCNVKKAIRGHMWGY